MAAGLSSSGAASPGGEQWDVLLDELEASTLAHGGGEGAASSPPGQQLERQLRGSSSARQEENGMEALAVAAGQPAVACTVAMAQQAAQEQPASDAGQLAAASSPGRSSSSGGSATLAGSRENVPESTAPATEPDTTAQRALPSRLLRRLATHVQHDSVGSVAGEEHAAAATSQGQAAAGRDPTTLAQHQPLPHAAAAQLIAAAEAADLAQRLLDQAHTAAQQEVATRQARAAAAEQAAVAAEARVQARQAEGPDATSAAGDAAR